MKITYSTTTKLRLLSQFQNVNESLKVFADYHNVGAGSLKRWIQQYLTGGLANLERPVHNRRYPKKLKLRAVRDYRNHRLPTKEILLKYDRSSPKCWCKLNSANLSFHKLKHTGFF